MIISGLWAAEDQEAAHPMQQRWHSVIAVTEFENWILVLSETWKTWMQWIAVKSQKNLKENSTQSKTEVFCQRSFKLFLLLCNMGRRLDWEENMEGLS